MSNRTDSATFLEFTGIVTFATSSPTPEERLSLSDLAAIPFACEFIESASQNESALAHQNDPEDRRRTRVVVAYSGRALRVYAIGAETQTHRLDKMGTGVPCSGTVVERRGKTKSSTEEVSCARPAAPSGCITTSPRRRNI